MKKIAPVAVSIMLLLFLTVGTTRTQEKPDKRPVTLAAGLGNLHHPIHTSSAEAQKFFDQGLTLVYAFNHEDAARSFRRASELDPAAPMPWWGIALAVGPNYNNDVDPEREKTGYEAIQKARSLAANGSEGEHAYVDALARRYSADPKADLKRLAVEYKDAMRDLWHRYPDDPDAGTLYAESMMDLHPWQLWTLDGKPGEDTAEIVEVLSLVLRRVPQHVGANHYYIHALEASPHPEDALPSANRLGTMVPAAGHLVHMPSHIYNRTGFYSEAVKANQAAAAADRAYLKATGGEGGIYSIMYYSHNLHFLAHAASMEGRSAEARHAADQLVANVTPAVKSMPMAEPFLPMYPWVLVRFKQWDDILKLPAPDASLQLSTSMWHYARSVAFTAKGKVSEAQAERAALAKIREKQPADAMFGLNSASKVMGLALEVLDARLAAAQGDSKSAIERWRKAVEVQDTFAYDEPPDWYYPVRESLGAALYRDRQYREAEKAFRTDLERNTRNPRSLYGLAETLKAQKRTSDAAWVETEFRQAWKNADAPLRIGDL